MRNGKLSLFLFSAPLLIVWLLLYLVIMHTDLFSWVNIEQLKSFTPNIFMPLKRDGLYNEAVLTGTISYISIFVLPLYGLLFMILKTTSNTDELSKRLSYVFEKQGKFGYWKFFFIFLVVFVGTIIFLFAIHDSSSSNYTIKSLSFIKAYPKRYLLMDFIVLNTMYLIISFSFFLVISPLFFYAKKEKQA